MTDKPGGGQPGGGKSGDKGEQPKGNDGSESADGPRDSANRAERQDDGSELMGGGGGGGGHLEVDTKLDEIMRGIAEEQKKKDEADRDKQRQESNAYWERQMKTSLR